MPQFVIDELAEFERDNNPLLEFYEELSMNPIIGQTTEAIYGKYLNFCARSGIKASSRRSISRKIAQQFNLCVKHKRVKGGLKYIFQEKK